MVSRCNLIRHLCHSWLHFFHKLITNFTIYIRKVVRYIAYMKNSIVRPFGDLVFDASFIKKS